MKLLKKIFPKTSEELGFKIWETKKRVKGQYYIFIADNFGESFKDFILNNKVSQLKDKLLQGVKDDESIQTIHVILKRIMNYPDYSNRFLLNRKKHKVVGGLLGAETEASQIKLFNSMLKRKHKFSRRFFEESVFYYQHGLKIMNAEVDEYLKGGDIMDVGAHNGASAVMFSKNFDFNKVYSFEISEKSMEEYRRNLNYFSVQETKCVLTQTGLTAPDKTGFFAFSDSGSAGLSIKSDSGKKDLGGEKVALKTLDQVVDELQITPRLIKADIEGACFDMVSGALNTIAKFRPILSLAIYHNPEEFFKVKPLLEEHLSDYTFMFRKLTPHIRDNYIHSEVILLAYPNEIKC